MKYKVPKAFSVMAASDFGFRIERKINRLTDENMDRFNQVLGVSLDEFVEYWMVSCHGGLEDFLEITAVLAEELREDTDTLEGDETFDEELQSIQYSWPWDR